MAGITLFAGWGASPPPLDKMKLLYGTHWIAEDEPCLGLYEMNLQSPGSRGFHRYQVVYVMRGDEPAEYRMDLGEDIKADEFRLLGGDRDTTTGKFWIEETVGSLRQIADLLRGSNLFDKRELVQINNLKE